MQKIIDMNDWDNLVEDTYNRPYFFQQQKDGRARGLYNLTIPSKSTNDDDMHDNIPDRKDTNIMGVKFQKWLKRNPKTALSNGDNTNLIFWWERNFYPCINEVANDLYKKGLIKAGNYQIDINW